MNNPPTNEKANAELHKLEGFLERITYQNPENGFMIGRFVEGKQKKPITVKGLIFNVHEGQSLKLWGDWEEHREYGRQFAVTGFLSVEPTSLEGIEKYLASGIIKGVRRKLAKRIVQAFGDKTLEVIDQEPERLLEVPKFPKKALEEVKTAWGEHKAVSEIMVFLHSQGVSQAYAERIFQVFGFSSVEVIRDNPYRLAMEVSGIGFRIADAIAKRLGVAQDAPQRAEAGVLFALDEINMEGHTGYPRAKLVARAGKILEVNAPVVDQAIETLIADGLLHSTEPEADDQSEFLARNRMHRAEESIARHLNRIEEGGEATRFTGIDEGIAQLEEQTGIVLDAEQRRAVEAALKHKVLIVTGGPGTGKTTIIRFILELVSKSIPTLALAAPTGRAAKRLAEATGKPASTIHRLLEAGKSGFERNRDNPLEVELVILDETSMIDTVLMESVLEALEDHARLVLVGDVDQLPSVGPGMVLSDLIASNCLPVARLERIFRQSERSLITANAHQIRKGHPPDLGRTQGEELVDFYFMKEGDPEKIVEKILTMVAERIPERFNFNPLTEVQVLTPMHKGQSGAQNLNRMLQERLNPEGAEMVFGETRFRVGDKVMQTRNNYDKEVFNGDMGVITGYDADDGMLEIQFDDRPVVYERKELDELTLGYAITVHKSQGSEYPAVVMPVSTQHAIMLQRNLLYTAITRGRRLVVMVGTEKAVSMAVHNDRTDMRYTRLKKRMITQWAESADAPEPPENLDLFEGEQ